MASMTDADRDSIRSFAMSVQYGAFYFPPAIA